MPWHHHPAESRPSQIDTLCQFRDYRRVRRASLRRLKAYSVSRNFRYSQGLVELDGFGEHIHKCRGFTAYQLHATSTGADESNQAKVEIGGDDGHDERENGG